MNNAHTTQTFICRVTGTENGYDDIVILDVLAGTTIRDLKVRALGVCFHEEDPVALYESGYYHVAWNRA